MSEKSFDPFHVSFNLVDVRQPTAPQVNLVNDLLRQNPRLVRPTMTFEGVSAWLDDTLQAPDVDIPLDLIEPLWEAWGEDYGPNSGEYLASEGY